ncbi:MAG: hypothetical protein NTW03_02630, partial [Verrucomicrobia bacterium]|nr:hypothetical protein [Verrucomicrobiota bacterium]
MITGFVLIMSWLGLSAGAQTPEPFTILGARLRAPNQLDITWQSCIGGWYQLEATPALGESFLPASRALTASNGTSALVVSVADVPGGFYRISILDTDAGAYCQRADVTNAQAVRAIHNWVAGLKALGLFSNAVCMMPLRASQNQGNGSTVYALRGSDGAFVNNPAWDERGLLFTGNQAVEFANPFTTNSLGQFSLFAVFSSDHQPARTIIGSRSASYTQDGPVLIAGGSPAQGDDPNELFFEYSTDGHTIPWPPAGGRRTWNMGNTGTLQFSLFTYAPTNMSLQSNIDGRYQTANTYPAAWNGNSRWRLGSFLNGEWPFVGTLSFAAVFDVALSQTQYDSVRRLYQTTLGSGLHFPPVNLVIEGDSLSA